MILVVKEWLLMNPFVIKWEWIWFTSWSVLDFGRKMRVGCVEFHGCEVEVSDWDGRMMKDGHAWWLWLWDLRQWQSWWWRVVSWMAGGGYGSGHGGATGWWRLLVDNSVVFGEAQKPIIPLESIEYTFLGCLHCELRTWWNQCLIERTKLITRHYNCH